MQVSVQNNIQAKVTEMLNKLQTSTKTKPYKEL